MSNSRSDKGQIALFFRPLLDNGLKGGNLKGLLSVVTLVSVCLSVCLYVCMSVIKLQVTVFDPVS